MFGNVSTAIQLAGDGLLPNQVHSRDGIRDIDWIAACVESLGVGGNPRGRPVVDPFDTGNPLSGKSDAAADVSLTSSCRTGAAPSPSPRRRPGHR